MRIVIAMGLAIGLLHGADAVQADDGLQGTWTLTAGEASGKALTEKQLKDGKLVLKGDHYSVTLQGAAAITGVQKLGSMKELKTIDITDASGSHKGQTCLGIYELKGDEFRVTFAPPGKPRPSKFATTADNGHWIHVWKHVKE